MKIQKGLVDNTGCPSSDRDGVEVDGVFFSSQEVIQERCRLQILEDKRMWPNLKPWQISSWIKWMFGNLINSTVLDPKQ
jgi:hypothetical protein